MTAEEQPNLMLTRDTVKYHGLEIGETNTRLDQVWHSPGVAELAQAIAAEHVRPNTDRAFAGDWQTWLAFCEAAQQEGVDAVPLLPSPDTLVIFARWLSMGGRMPDGTLRRRAAPESARRRLTGVIAGWKREGLHVPQGVSTNARQWVKAHETQLIADRKPVGRGQAQPLRVDHLRMIAAATPPTLAGARDMALVLLDFSVGGRRSELAYLDVEDITPDDGGVEVHIRRSKTGHRRPAVTFGQNPETCPVRAWRHWQEMAGIESGAAFRTVDRHGNLGARMSGEAVSAVITRAGRRAALPYRVTGHSARRGLATEARRAGHSVEQIADQGGWGRTSPVLHRYIESVDKWSNNVLAGLGL